ncbi:MULTISPECIES: ABC-2 transporter permease [Clostridium]|uniref:ABC-2 transporter permease n=1 Tax=Clostridium TaxID=1485 RepID=UPI0005FB31B2|nr:MULTISPECIES: ABC-2 transporter permease [Clostridium]KJZ86310.1 putative membrane protein [Clostridium sp. IBUN22A]KJZ88329.1 putative membrane protein [Clostridium sp. IBUN125C]KJZ91375.1 putative membrane protein [Clostridium sp. IBUN62F]KJZ97475.1 NAD-reducing hydrogenase subunit HoxF [Clostridium sp. IBUN13A]MBZ0310871.1 ABC-2 transporter permease [Clostridium butyricum]
MNNIKNLLKLHYSSIFALKKTALIILALAVFMTISNNDGSMLPFGAALLVMVLNYNSLAYESNSKSDFLIYSLPVKPKEYVLSKYIFGFINVIISIIFADVLYMVLNMFNYISQQDIPVGIINIAVIIVGMIIVDIVNPIAIVVGFNKARIILIFLAIMPICFSSTIVFALSKIDFFNINISMGIMETIVAIVGVILTTASYFITAHLYERKDIN